MYHKYTKEEKESIANWISASINLLIERDSDLLTPRKIQTDFKIEGQNEFNREIHETTINHRLARYIEDLQVEYGINHYHVDIEYNRYINNKKKVRSILTGEYIEVRPDILIHKRTRLNEPIPHLLVVEAKKRSIIEKDRNHVLDLMMDSNYRYKFGLLVSYYESESIINCELVTLKNGEFLTSFFSIDKKPHFM